MAGKRKNLMLRLQRLFRPELTSRAQFFPETHFP
jgi:hypothetical protein